MYISKIYIPIYVTHIHIYKYLYHFPEIRGIDKSRMACVSFSSFTDDYTTVDLEFDQHTVLTTK